MKTLTLMRHAKSDWSHRGLADHERPLNRRGLEAAPEMAARLAARWEACSETGGQPDLLLSSYAVRAKTTADYVGKALGMAVQTEKRLYPFIEAEVAQVIAATAADVEHLMLFGHNPGISFLAARLGAVAASEMPTAAVVSMQFDVESWAQVLTAKVSDYWFDYPKSGDASQAMG